MYSDLRCWKVKIGINELEDSRFNENQTGASLENQ